MLSTSNDHKEIERKFLVTGEFIETVISSHEIAQGYISNDPARSVRVRLVDKKGYLNIKGETTSGGISRFEWEKEISHEDAIILLGLCKGYIIEKTRHIVDFKGHIFEIDQFHGENEGLLVAEIELGTEDEHFEKPEWLGNEVSHDVKYYNSELSVTPFSHW
jgi:CYTH domain-containing protein